MSSQRVPDLKIDRFEGPLDLLFHLIEKNDIDIYDIPIAEITDQYLAFLQGMSVPDMDIASEFLVMAATLIHIKTKMMLPGIRTGASAEEGEDPREELVIRLLQYRRCKILAQDLRDRYAYYSNSHTRLPTLPKTLGISIPIVPQEFEPDCFNRAMMAVCARNEIRFADISSKITHLLKREKVSIRDKMKAVWQKLMEKGRIFFHEIFPSAETATEEKVAGFLAVLELLRSNRISADQKRPFDVILLSKKEERARKESRMYLKEQHHAQKENQA